MTNGEKVVDALTRANGKTLTTSEIMALTGLSYKQVAAGVSAARRDRNVPVLSNGRGAYLIIPTGKPTPEVIPDDSPAPSLMEYVGRAKSGSLIVRDEAGRLYLATPVDL